jgi:hypothetical protein
MYIEQIVIAPAAVSMIKQAADLLEAAKYFPAALEIGVISAGSITGDALIEKAAIQRAYIEGYHRAVSDLFHFRERFVDTIEQRKVPTDYGAIERLVNSNTLTREEANEHFSK